MNNIDKLVKKSLRNKYFRAPTVKDIKVEIKGICKEYYRVTLIIGNYYRSKEYDICPWDLSDPVTSDMKRNRSLFPTRKQLCNIFNNNKTIKNLKPICVLIDTKLTSIMKAGYKKALLNKEGIEFTKSLKSKLQNAKMKLEDVVEDMKNLQAEISVLDPYTKSLYSESNNRHINDLKWSLKAVDDILRINKSL